MWCKILKVKYFNNSLEYFITTAFGFFPIGSCSSHIYNYYGSSGYLYSPGYPGCYADNLMCTWLIEAPFGYHVYVNFYHFSLEYGGSNCPYDFLEIRDGNTLSSPLITKACGSLGYFYMYSSGRFLLLRFRTDGSVQASGFAGYYSTLSYGKGYIYLFEFLILLTERTKRAKKTETTNELI